MAYTPAQVLVVGMILVCGLAVLRATDVPPEACAARATVPSHVRPLDCGMATIVTNGMARSATFRRLVDSVGALNGIVYITEGYYVRPGTKRVLSGTFSHHISVAGAYRVLHVMVAPESGDRPLIAMAHELQHAIEVLETTDVATEAAVDQLFERIGIHAGTGIVETQAALEMERAVARAPSDPRIVARGENHRWRSQVPGRDSVNSLLGVARRQPDLSPEGPRWVDLAIRRIELGCHRRRRSTRVRH